MKKKNRYSYDVIDYAQGNELTVNVYDNKKKKISKTVDITTLLTSFIVTSGLSWYFLQKSPNFETMLIEGEWFSKLAFFVSSVVIFAIGLASISMVLFIIRWLCMPTKYSNQLYLDAEKFTNSQSWNFHDARRVQNILDDEKMVDNFLMLINNHHVIDKEIVQDTFNQMYQLSSKDISSINIMNTMSDKYKNKSIALEQIKHNSLANQEEVMF